MQSLDHVSLAAGEFLILLGLNNVPLPSIASTNEGGVILSFFEPRENQQSVLPYRHPIITIWLDGYDFENGKETDVCITTTSSSKRVSLELANIPMPADNSRLCDVNNTLVAILSKIFTKSNLKVANENIMSGCMMHRCTCGEAVPVHGYHRCYSGFLKSREYIDLIARLERLEETNKDLTKQIADMEIALRHEIDHTASDIYAQMQMPHVHPY
jgi:hypothetical protein